MTTELHLHSPPSSAAMSRLHLRLGWTLLLLFLSMGMVLESLHALKSGYYLDVGNETRRLMWRLSHAHGTLFAMLNMCFAVTIPWCKKPQRLASRLLTAASLLMPIGFFLGGLGAVEGDPGAGVLLALPGGLFLFIGVLLTALALRNPSSGSPSASAASESPATSPED